MAAYVLAMVEVTEPVKYVEYTKLTPAALAAAGGRFVLIEFPTKEAARGFYESAAYGEAREIRKDAARATFLLLEGWAPAV